MRHQIQLLALIAYTAKFADSLPTEIKLLNWGANATRKGTVRVGRKTLSLLPLSQKELGYDRVAIDFEHNTVPGTEAYKESKEPRDVAAYGVPQVRENDGLYLVDIEWTPIGREMARNYADFSPAVKLDKTGEVLFLHSIALCRQGSVDGLRAFSMELPVGGNGPSTMHNEEEQRIMDKILMALRKMLKLADDADEAAVAAALEQNNLVAFSAQVGEIQKNITTLSAAIETLKKGAPADGKQSDDKTAGLEAQIVALSASVKAVQDGMTQRDRQDLVSQAAREGKVIPLSAEQIAATPVETLRDVVSKLPVTVPMDKRVPANVVIHSVTPQLTEMEKKICRQMGVSEEAYLKQKNGK